MTRWCLVVEDEASIGEMICDNLQFEGWGTELVGDGKKALDRLLRGGVDLVILDIMLPVLDGFEVLARMRARGDATPVLILSARGNDRDRIRGLELQADDYLGKPFNLKELLLRVKALARRTRPAAVGDDVLSFAGNEVDFRALLAKNWQGEDVALTASEAKLLRVLAARPGEVVARQELVTMLFGPAAALTHRTLDNLVLSLRKAFERDPARPVHILTVRGVGLKFVPEGTA